MPGKRPHYMMDVFRTSEDARKWIDPQGERIWEEPEPHAAGVVSISPRIQRRFGSRSFSVALGHISRDEFMAYLLGRDLEPGVAERIEQHIAECDACAELGEQVDNIIEAFGWNRKGGAAGSE
jgi:hypothetical protein